MDIDEVAVGGNNNAGLPDEFVAAADEEDYSCVSTHDLLADANSWKARRAGYERVAAAGAASADAETFFAMLHPVIAKKETNAAAMEVLLETLALLLDLPLQLAHGSSSGAAAAAVDPRQVHSSRVALVADAATVGFLIERAMQSPKAKTLAHSCAVLRHVIRGGEGPRLLSHAQALLASKAPKVRAKALSALNIIVEEAGIDALPKKDFFAAAVLPFFNDVDPKVRKEALGIVSTCYLQSPQAVRAGFNVSALRAPQQAEIQKTFEQIDENRDALLAEMQAARPPPPPSHHLAPAAASGNTNRAAGGAASAAASAFAATTASAAVAAAARPLRFLHALQLHKDVYPTATDKSLKWQDRLEPVTRRLLPKLQEVERASHEDDYAELAKFCKELIVDRQLPLEQAGHRCIVELGRALGEHFAAHYARFVVPALFDKFKDKKTFGPAARTLLALYEHRAISLPSCDELLEEGLASKVPQQRLSTLEFIAKIASAPSEEDAGNSASVSATANELKGALSRSTAALVRTSADDKADVREAFVLCMRAVLQRCGGAGAFRDVLGEVDEKVRRKLLGGGADDGFAQPLPSQSQPQSARAKPSQQQQQQQQTQQQAARRRPVSPTPVAPPSQKSFIPQHQQQHHHAPAVAAAAAHSSQARSGSVAVGITEPSAATMHINGNFELPAQDRHGVSQSARSSLAVYPSTSTRNSAAAVGVLSPMRRSADGGAGRTASSLSTMISATAIAELDALEGNAAWPAPEQCYRTLVAALPNIATVAVPTVAASSHHESAAPTSRAQSESRPGSRASSVASSRDDNVMMSSSFAMLSDNSMVLDETNSVPANPLDAAALSHPMWRVREKAWRCIGAAIEESRDITAEDATQLVESLIVWGCFSSKLAATTVTTHRNESVVQVVNAMMHAVHCLVGVAATIPPHVAAALVAWALPRFSDAKVRAHVGPLLSLLTEHLGPPLLFRLVAARAMQLKVPKVLCEALEWIELSVREFRDAPIDIPFLMRFATEFVFSSSLCPQPAVRSAGVKLVATLVVHAPNGAGVRIRSQLRQMVDDGENSTSSSNGGAASAAAAATSGGGNVNAHLLQHIDDEIEKRMNGGDADGAVASPRSHRQQQQAQSGSQPVSSSQQQQQHVNVVIRPSPATLPVGKAILEQHHGLGGNSQSSFVMSAMNSFAVENNHNEHHHQHHHHHDSCQITHNAAAAAAEEAPRYDIAADVRPLIRDLTDGKDWRERLAALKKIDTLVRVTGSNHIQSASGVPELLRALKQRLDESSKNFVHDALKCMHSVLRAAGPPSSAAFAPAARAAARAVMPAALAFLGDQKPALRDEAARLGAALFAAVGVEPVLSDVARLLAVESQYAKGGLLELLVAQLEGGGELATLRPKALMPLVAPLMKLLTDRSLDVRAQATRLLSCVVSNCGGAEPLLRALGAAKPADVLVLQPLIEKAAASFVRSATPPPSAMAAAQTPPPQQQQQQQQRSVQQQSVMAAAPVAASSSSSSVGGGGSIGGFPLPPSASVQPRPQFADPQSGGHMMAMMQQQQQQQQRMQHEIECYAQAPPAYLHQQQQIQQMHMNGDHAMHPHESSSQHHQQAQRRGDNNNNSGSSSSSSPTRQQQQQQHQQYSAESIIQNMIRASNAAVERMCLAVQEMTASDPQQLSTRLVLALLARLRNETMTVREPAFDARVVAALLQTLVACLSVPDFVAGALDVHFLFQLVGSVLELLACPLLVQPGRDRAMIRAVNMLALKMIENAQPEAIFEALMGRLMWHVGDYLDEAAAAENLGVTGASAAAAASAAAMHNGISNNNNSGGSNVAGAAEKMKTVETVIRCLFRVDLATVSIDGVVRGVHDFLTRFPPSHFRNRNDLPIRSVKMVLGNMCKVHEPELIRTRCRDLIGQSTLVYSFVHMCLVQQQQPQEQPAAAVSHLANSMSPTPAPPAPQQQQQQRRPQLSERAPNQVSNHASPVKSPPAHEKQHPPPQSQQQRAPVEIVSADALAAMFARARKHETAEEGAKELAQYVAKFKRTDDFMAMYNRCSEAFRMYLDRRIEKLLQ